MDRVSEIKELEDFVREYDLVLVEGPDCVGKSTLIKDICSSRELCTYSLSPYSWVESDLVPTELSWALNLGILDFLSEVGNLEGRKYIFDRSVISGVVYNNQVGLLERLKRYVKDIRILVLYVTVPPGQYGLFCDSRPEDNIGSEEYESLCRRYESVMDYLDRSTDVQVVEFLNRYEG